MAGFRTFATGEVLTAANVNNFLMKQSVMVFADDAARTTALGAEVTEGMLTFNKDTGALEVFDGTDFVPAGAEPPAGIGSNVVSTTKTDTFTVTSATYQDVTGLTVTITPSSATAKVLVLLSLSMTGTDGATFAIAQLVRNSTPIAIATSTGSRSAATVQTSPGDNVEIESTSMVTLDAPATTSATTYKVQISAQSASAVFVNRSTGDGNDISTPRVVSSITVIEVAA